MDRYVTRERRAGTEYPQGNQAIPFSTTTIGNNITMPEYAYYNMYNNAMNNPETYNYNANAIAPQMQTYSPNVNRQDFHEYQVAQPSHIAPGVDYHYFAYPDHNAAYTTGQPNIQANTIAVNAFGGDYQNRNFIGADRTDGKHYTSLQQRTPNVQPPEPFSDFPKPIQKSSTENIKPVQKIAEATPKKQVETDLLKSEAQYEVKPRAEKLKELHKTGTRVFCGSIENILKWHKMIQDIGVMVLYDIVGKCVSVRSGESCAKNLVVRDENGPAMQVVYYEIDFLLPKLQVPCTVRVLGRVLPACNRVHAFSVRAATGDDIATLPRRAAVAAHHVAKLCRDYC